MSNSNFSAGTDSLSLSLSLTFSTRSLDWSGVEYLSPSLCLGLYGPHLIDDIEFELTELGTI